MTEKNLIESIEQLNKKIDGVISQINDYKFNVEIALKKSEQLMGETINQEVEVNKLLTIGKDVDTSNRTRNEEVIKALKDTLTILSANKDEISDSILSQLNISDVMERLSRYSSDLQIAIENIGTNNEASTHIQESLQTQVKVLIEQTSNIKRITESLGLNVDFNREVQDIIKYLKKKKGVSIKDLNFRFSQPIVKYVLETGENLGYWKLNI